MPSIAYSPLRPLLQHRQQTCQRQGVPIDKADTLAGTNCNQLLTQARSMQRQPKRKIAPYSFSDSTACSASIGNMSSPGAPSAAAILQQLLLDAPTHSFHLFLLKTPPAANSSPSLQGRSWLRSSYLYYPQHVQVQQQPCTKTKHTQPTIHQPAAALPARCAPSRWPASDVLMQIQQTPHLYVVEAYLTHSASKCSRAASPLANCLTF